MNKANIVSLWLEACPSFRTAFVESCTENGSELLYLHAAAFARHLLELQRLEKTNEFGAVAIFIEGLHTDDDPATREFATIGILEGIQNVWGHSEVSPNEFLPYLLPASAAAWRKLDQFWSGDIPFIPDTHHLSS
ncbi:MAG TPA: hypothetical protein PK490_17125 [Prosthecobacter sp.]|nr:hypothetical protein [Prosthecobacter sp.]HRK16010.1 hypothetical protein [Prosthecobacter sp.]